MLVGGVVVRKIFRVDTCAFIWTMVFARHARFVRRRTSFNREMLVVGGVGGGNPATHSPTNQHPSTYTYPPTIQGLFADAHRLTVTAVLTRMVKRRTR